MPHSYEFSSPAASMPPEIIPPTEGPEGQLISRRGMFERLGIFAAGAAVVAVGLELGIPEQAHAADTDPSTTNPPTPPTDADSKNLNDARINELNKKAALDQAQTALDRAQTQQIEDGLHKPWYATAAESIGGFSAAVAVVGGLLGGGATLRKHFAERGKELVAKQEATEQEKNEAYARAVQGIEEAHKCIMENPKSKDAVAILHLAYSQIEAFTTDERFADQIFNLAAGLLRDRAMALADMPPRQREAWAGRRRNAHREAFKLLSKVAPQLPREDVDGEAVLPNADGISLAHLNFMRRPLERLSLEGAYFQDLKITGSLAGSHFKLARMQNVIFGDRDSVCDLRGADLSKADLKGARFERVRIDEHTKLGAGQEGNPCATFGTVIFDPTLGQERGQEKIAAAQAVIKDWQQKHPTRTRFRIVERIAQLRRSHPRRSSVNA